MQLWNIALYNYLNIPKLNVIIVPPITKESDGKIVLVFLNIIQKVLLP